MRRLAWLPVLFAAGATWAFFSGMAWPIAVTGWRCVAARADAPDYEPEVL